MSARRTYPVAPAHGIARFDFLTGAFNLKSRNLFGDVFDRILLSPADSGVSVVQDGLRYFGGIQSGTRHLSGRSTATSRETSSTGTRSETAHPGGAAPRRATRPL